MKKITVTFFLLLAAVFTAAAQDGYQLMKRVDNAATPKTSHALVQMNLTDQKGQVNQRIIEEWSAVDNNGNTHSVLVFHTPASVKNTRFLTVEQTEGDDNQWIFLPSLNRVRRIASGESDSSFMGTEFTYYDMRSRNVDNFTYKVLGKGKVLGYECYKVEAVPKTGTDSPYARSVHWVTVDSNVNSVLRIDIYKNGTDLSKVFMVDELKQISGYWTPVKVTMTNKESGRSTTLYQEKLVLDKAVNTRRFSQRFLETGRTE